ncbi:hypothetical protein T11_14463 [Trichinella zimbabwensis]|uniref:Uncharacterized protein n=1 Tax=Trichinella zimbabwensis TaxID=268475 RepID=A0A0V1HBE2_9BILA|nr:hypothetical protein T11_14463 [Trichinella zimbabwensis]
MPNVGDENSNLSTIPLEYKVKRCISSSFKQTSANVLGFSSRLVCPMKKPSNRTRHQLSPSLLT